MEDGRSSVPALIRLEHALLELSFAALVVMNAANVFARYVMNRSIGSLFEIMVLLSVAIYWLGIATAERSRAHLGMNFVTVRLKGSLRQACQWLRLAVICAFLLAAAYSAASVAWSQLKSGAVSGTLGLPLWPFTLSIPLGCLLMLARALQAQPDPGTAAPEAGTDARRSD